MDTQEYTEDMILKLLDKIIDEKDKEIERLREESLHLKSIIEDRESMIVQLQQALKEEQLPIDEKTKAYLILRKIKEHFKDHHYFTADDFEQFEREEYHADVRRGIVTLDGGSSEIESFDPIDLP